MHSKTLGGQRRRVTVRGLMAITSATTPLALLAGALVLPVAESAKADTTPYWTGLAGDNNFNTIGNWSSAPDGSVPSLAKPTAGDTVTFNASSTNGTTIIFQNHQNEYASQFVFTNTGSTQILGGESIGQTNISQNDTLTNGMVFAAGAGQVTFGVNGSAVNIMGFNIDQSQTYLNNSSHTVLFSGTGADNTFGSSTSTGGIQILTFDGSGGYSVGAGFVNHTGSVLGIIKNGSGTLTVSGNVSSIAAANQFTGGVVVNAGSLIIGGSNAFDTAATNTITINGGAVAALNATRTIPGVVSWAIDGSCTFGMTGTTGATLQLNGQASLNGSSPTITCTTDQLTFADGLIGTGGFTKSGTGIMAFTGTGASYSGSTIISQGTVQAALSGGFNVLSPNSDYVVQSGGTLGLQGNSETIGSLSGAGIVTVGNATAGQLTMGGNSNSTTFSGTITGTGSSGGLVKNGSGTFVLSGSDSNAGANGLTVNGGTFVAANSGGTALANFSTLNVNSATFQLATASQQINSAANVTLSSGTVDLNSLNLTVGSLTGDANSSVALGGGTLTVGGNSSTYSGNIADTGGASSNTGGTLVMAGSGTLNLASNTGLTLPNLTVNSGTVSLGGGSGATAPFNVTGTMTINDGTEVAYLPNPSGGVTNTVSSLVINGGGQLDLANHTLVTTTSASTIRQYLIAGANIVGTNPAAWNGTGGISSVNAAASTNHLTALGYSTGTHSALGIALGLAPNQTVVKYTIMGDANLDGSVDISDLDIVLSNYASGKPPTWDTGDFTYAGQTDITDLNIVLSNYAKSAPATVATPSVARPSVKAASGPQTLTGTVSPAVASGAIELDVNTITGDAVLNPNNVKVVSLQVASSSGNLIPNNWQDLSFYYGTTHWADSSFQTINLAEYDTAYTSRHDSLLLTAPVDYGDIFNTSGPHDLTFEYGIPDADGSDVDTEVGVVVYSSGVPEPTTLGLMGLAMAGLMGRRRRKEQK